MDAALYMFSYELEYYFSMKNPYCSDCNCMISSQYRLSHELQEYVYVYKPYYNNCKYMVIPQ